MKYFEKEIEKAMNNIKTIQLELLENCWHCPYAIKRTFCKDCSIEKMQQRIETFLEKNNGK